VLCGSLQHVIGVDLDVLVVLGMAEGSFPPTGVSASLLSESERVAIGSPMRREARACDERRSFLAALSSAPRRWLLHPRAGAERVAHPSPWLDPSLIEREQTVFSYDAELSVPTGPPASLQERDLRSLRSCPHDVVAQHPLVASNTNLTRGFTAIAARGSDQFTEWEGAVGRHVELAIGETVLSATALETWASCPARYFFKNVLGVREQDDIGDVDELEARYRGSLVHNVLEGLGREHLERFSRGDQPALPGFPSWTVTAREVVERVTDFVFDEFERKGSAPYPILWEVEKRRIVRDVLRTLDADEPTANLLAVEHRFGGDEQPEFAIALPSGQALRFRGSIDRVDQLRDRLQVIDYKTGKPESEKTVRAGIASGTLLQLPLYALAAQREFGPNAPVDAGYWYVSAKGAWKRVIIAIDAEVRRRFLATLETISAQIAEGVFPANPGDEGWPTFKNCTYCEYDRICPADRDRAWLRLEEAPALLPYIELSAPEPTTSSESDADT
jgi:RecB family exonuclease